LYQAAGESERKEESGMYARLTKLEASSDRIDDTRSYIKEQVLPQLQQTEGFKGFIVLGDRQSGEVRTMGLWESQEALRATEEAASGVRGEVEEAVGGRVADIERYEVFVFEVEANLKQ
jgi:osmotically-inducible protein OsmY